MKIRSPTPTCVPVRRVSPVSTARWWTTPAHPPRVSTVALAWRQGGPSTVNAPQAGQDPLVTSVCKHTLKTTKNILVSTWSTGWPLCLLIYGVQLGLARCVETGFLKVICVYFTFPKANPEI